MTLDAELTERLHAVADRVPVDDPPVARFVRRGRRRSRTKIVGVVSSVVVVLAGAGVLGNQLMHASESATVGGAPIAGGEPRPSPGYLGRDADRVVAGLEVRNRRFGFMPSGSASAGAIAGPAPQQPQLEEPSSEELGGIGPRIVKTGRLEVEVPEGEFQERFADARSVASRYSGFVTAAATEGQDARTGRIVIRVPVARFDAALDDLTSLGVLRAEEVRGVDVTEEFVDLQGRLKVHTRHQRFLFRKLGQTNSIGESIRIREMLEDVQFEVERLRGQLRLLRDRSNFATIDVSMYEVGSAPEQEEGTSPLAGAWDRALHGTETVVAAIVVGLGYLLPVLVLLLLLWLGGRQLRARIA